MLFNYNIWSSTAEEIFHLNVSGNCIRKQCFYIVNTLVRVFSITMHAIIKQPFKEKLKAFRFKESVPPILI